MTVDLLGKEKKWRRNGKTYWERRRNREEMGESIGKGEEMGNKGKEAINEWQGDSETRGCNDDQLKQPQMAMAEGVRRSPKMIVDLLGKEKKKWGRKGRGVMTGYK
ncbi:hypothetical protein SLA2020_014350 [Shorea laevis]